MDQEPKAPRRKNVVSIEAPAEVDALALLLGKTSEEFVAEAVRQEVARLQQKIQQSVAGVVLP